jgi:RNA polymerase sigma-70 factor, ECF subfamily
LKDQLLIEGLGRRDKAVFDYVFNYYYSSLCAFSNKYLDDHDACEDLVQDFFVSLWVEAPQLKITSSLKSYLFACIKYRSLDFRKHHKVIEKYQAHILLTTEGVENTTDQYYAESELRQAIQKSLEKLSPRCREIFELSRLKGLSNNEISEKLGISKRTVEIQISNSLKILRKELVEYLPLWIVVWLIG